MGGSKISPESEMDGRVVVITGKLAAIQTHINSTSSSIYGLSTGANTGIGKDTANTAVPKGYAPS